MSNELTQYPAPSLSRRRLLQTSGAAALALVGGPTVLSACASSSTGKATGGDIPKVTWSVFSDAGLNPANDLSSNAALSLALGMEGLLAYSGTGGLVPALAESYTQESPLVYKFKIRNGVTWHDGKPFTADDVVYQFKFYIDPKTPTGSGGYWLGNVASVEKTGDSEVTFRLTKPNPQFASWTAYDQGWISRRDQIENGAYKSVGSPGKLPIGTGPYKYTSVVSGSSISATEYHGYWGKRPRVKNVELVVQQDNEAQLLAMRSGEIDGVLPVPLSLLSQYQQISGARIFMANGDDQWFISMNCSRPPFDDLNVRKAMLLALDRKGIAEAVFGGHAEPATALVPPGYWGSFMPSDQIAELYNNLPRYDYDIRAAKAALQQSAHPNGFSLTVKTTSARPAQGLLMQVFAQALKQIGIEMTVTTVSDTAWFNEIAANDRKAIGMTINDYGIGGGNDPTNYLVIVDPGHAAPNLDNVSNWLNPSAASLYQTAINSASQGDRTRAEAQLMTLAAQQLPYLPVVWPSVAAATQHGLKYTGLSAFYAATPFTYNLSD